MFVKTHPSTMKMDPQELDGMIENVENPLQNRWSWGPSSAKLQIGYPKNNGELSFPHKIIWNGYLVAAYLFS